MDTNEREFYMRKQSERRVGGETDGRRIFDRKIERQKNDEGDGTGWNSLRKWRSVGSAGIPALGRWCVHERFRIWRSFWSARTPKASPDSVAGPPCCVFRVSAVKLAHHFGLGLRCSVFFRG